MVGRELSALFPKQDAEVGEPGAEGRAPHARGRVLRRLASRSAPARSSRWRARRRRPQRGGARDLRHRQAPTPATSRSPAGGSPAAARSPRCAPGIGFVPEDRRQQGLVMDLSIARNASLTRLRALARGGLIRSGAENRAGRASGPRGCSSSTTASATRVGTLSGGNQQKVVLGKWLATEPEGADRRRADARHRRRHEGRGPPPDERARRPGRRGPDDLQRAARGARHGRPRARHARGPPDRRAVAAPRPTRRA